LLLWADVSAGGRISIAIIHVLWIGLLVIVGLFVALGLACLAAIAPGLHGP
jgi:hypothetical protein